VDAWIAWSILISSVDKCNRSMRAKQIQTNQFADSDDMQKGHTVAKMIFNIKFVLKSKG